MCVCVCVCGLLTHTLTQSLPFSFYMCVRHLHTLALIFSFDIHI